MPNNNKLFLRELSSPYGDISRKRTLSFQDLDSNFIFLKGECINSMSIEDGNVILNKISGENMHIPISGISESIGSVTEDMISDLDSSLRKDIDDNRIWVWGSGGYKSVRVNNNSGTDATGDMSHAEGSNTKASGTASHAGGASSQANGDFSFAHTKGTSKADGESSVVLGGTLQVVENGGENGGIFAGDTNRILGLDYLKLIQDLQNELKVITAKRQTDNSHYLNSQDDISETISSKESEIEELSLHIEEIKSQINDLNIKLNQLNSKDNINLVIHQELTSSIESLEIKLKEKEELKKEREREIEALKIESKINKENESNAQKEYDEDVETIERLLDEYNTALNDFDGYLPKQSVIIGGSSNIINKASESIIDGGSGNTITTKVKNSGIFGGSENELGGGDYLNLIGRLHEELNQRAQEKAKYDSDYSKLNQSLESSIDDKEKQLESEKQQQPQDLALIATLEADIKELKEEKEALVEESSRNNANLSIPYATYETYVIETQKKIEEYKSKMFFDGENYMGSTITPIDNSSIISGSGNKIIHLSNNSSIIGGKSNLIDNASGSVILGGEGITATNNNTVYTPNLNIDIQPSNDNSLTQVLVRDVDGNIKYKDVASFTDLSVVSGVYDIRTGKVTLINNDGDSFEIAGFSSGMTDSYTTEAYLEDKTIYFNNNIKGDKLYSVDISPILDDIITSIGYDDRGTCSEEQYARYEHEVQTYYDSKTEYDEYNSSIQTLTDEITQLTSEVDTLRAELEFKTTDLMYTHITGGSVEELQAIINQKQEDLDIKWVNLEQKQLQKERDISDQQDIIDSGNLDFAPYAPANESNFNCWSEQQIIDSVGYDDRGNCSGDRYEKYLSEYNDVLDYYKTQLSPPESFPDLDLSDRITYNNLSTERQKSVDYWQQKTTYTNNLISSHNLEIAKYQTILDSEEDQSKIDELNKIILLLSSRKSEEESKYVVDEESYNKLILFFDTNLSYLESTDEYNFIQKYTPINEVNFNCWNDSEDYNDLHSQITGITSAVGYDDRGACSKEQYDTYEAEVQTYYSSKEVYDEYDSRIKTLTDEITQLNDDLLNASTQQESDAISKNIERKQVQKQAYTKSRQDIIDSGNLDFASYVPANEANFNCYINSLQNDKIDTKTDITLFNTYTSSTETIITGITSAVGYDDRGACSNIQYATYESEVQTYYDSKEVYDTYDSRIKTLTDEITALEDSKTTKETLLSTKQNELVSIKPGSDFIIANYDYIIAVNTLLEEEIQTIKSLIQGWDYGKSETEFLAEKTSVEAVITSSIDKWNTLNDLMVVNTTFNYQNKDSISSALTNIKNNLDSTQTILDTMSHTDTEQVFSQNKGRTIALENITLEFSTELQQDVSLAKDYYTQTNNDLDNEIQQLQADIVTISKNIEQRQVQKQAYTKIRQDIIDSGNLDFASYVPANEANFNCYINSLQNDKIDTKTDITLFNTYTSSTETTISAITSTIGIGDNDRGICSKERFGEYIDASDYYNRKKEEYDQYESNIQTLTDEITQLTADIDTLKTEINTLDRTITIGNLDGIDQTDNQNLKVQKESDLLAKQSQLRKKIEDKESDVGSQEVIKNSGALEFGPYAPVNEVNFNCWENNELNKITQHVSDSLGVGHRGSCDGKPYIMYLNLVHDLESHQSQNKTDIEYFNEQTQERNLHHQNYTKYRAVITDNISFYQSQLDIIKDNYESEDRDATPEELGKIAILEQLINELQSELNALDVSENTAVESYNEVIAQYNEVIANFENNIKPDIDRYLPENEVNYNCWRNEFFFNVLDSRDQAIRNKIDYQIYNIESALNRFSDRPGTFNYYPNIHDDFTENPRFIIGEFDDLDNIINLDGSSKITWASLLAYYMNAANNSTNPESYKQLSNNLDKSIDCLEYLLSKINSIEAEKNAEFNKVKADIDQDLQILNIMSEAPIDESDSKPLYVENIDRSVLQQRRQNLIDERVEEHSKFDYMEQKIEAALNVYEEIKYRSEMLLAEIESKL